MESNFAGPELTALFRELVRLEIELWDAVEDRVRAEHAMALGSYEVLSVIAREPGCRVHDVAAELSITVGGTSKVGRPDRGGRSLCGVGSNPGGPALVHHRAHPGRRRRCWNAHW